MLPEKVNNQHWNQHWTFRQVEECYFCALRSLFCWRTSCKSFNQDENQSWLMSTFCGGTQGSQKYTCKTLWQWQITLQLLVRIPKYFIFGILSKITKFSKLRYFNIFVEKTKITKKLRYLGFVIWTSDCISNSSASIYYTDIKIVFIDQKKGIDYCWEFSKFIS